MRLLVLEETVCSFDNFSNFAENCFDTTDVNQALSLQTEYDYDVVVLYQRTDAVDVVEKFRELDNKVLIAVVLDSPIISSFSTTMTSKLYRSGADFVFNMNIPYSTIQTALNNVFRRISGLQL